MKKYVTSLFLIPSLSFAFSLSGNFKSYPMIKDLVQHKDIQKSLVNSGKLQINENLPSDIKFEMGYELTATTEKRLFSTPTQSSYRVVDLDLYLHEEKPSNKYTTNLTQNLNRLNLNFTTSLGDLSLGRMPLSFGVSKSISANDVLTPVAINTIDKEERAGIDMLIIKAPITSTIMLDAGFIGGEEFKGEKNAYFLRPKLTIEKLDLTFNVMHFKEKNLIGFEMQHPIQDTGFWIDYAYVDKSNSRLKDFSRLTTGIDYKFKSSLYLAMEYHYNGASLENNSVYPEDFLYVRDYHYFIITSNYELTPLLTPSLQLFLNSKDKSIFSTLKFDYNLTDNSYLSLGTYQGLGNRTTSEFGRYGKIYFASYRYYF